MDVSRDIGKQLDNSPYQPHETQCATAGLQQIDSAPAMLGAINTLRRPSPILVSSHNVHQAASTQYMVFSCRSQSQKVRVKRLRTRFINVCKTSRTLNSLSAIDPVPCNVTDCTPCKCDGGELYDKPKACIETFHTHGDADCASANDSAECCFA